MTAPSGQRGLAAGLVTLLRPPNVFTAVADSLAGLALARGGRIQADDPGLLLLLSSACLYLGGMALNDYFDREIDARERPERPIPAGDVPPAFAFLVGAALLGGGLASAAFAGCAALFTAFTLATAIVVYDSLSKGTWAGFLNMGLCRGLNFCLPMTLAAEPFRAAFLAPPALLAAYIAALTYLSRDEVGGSTLERARRGLVAMCAVGLLAAAVVGIGASPLGWVFLAVLVARGAAIFAPLWTAPGGPTTGQAIGGGILLIPLFDATFVASAGHAAAALAVAALTLPAIWLRRIYSPT